MVDPAVEPHSWGPGIPPEDQLRLLGPVEGKRVLELGCRPPHASVALTLQGAKVTAVDHTAERLATVRRLAHEAGVKVTVRHGDFADLAFARNDSIDLAYSVYTLAEVQDLARVFRQANRVLIQDGVLVVSLPHPAFTMVAPDSRDPLVVERPYGESEEPGEDDLAAHTYAHTIADVHAALERGNFRVDTILEPKVTAGGHGSTRGAPAVRWIPPTFIMRGRKLGV